MMRSSALKEAGLLDETFFMYGEDIDLSYRLIKAGFKNYYFPESRIIHYKGESTKKGSVNYVFVFYRAMLIFAKKHFEKSQGQQMLTRLTSHMDFVVGCIPEVFPINQCSGYNVKAGWVDNADNAVCLQHKWHHWVYVADQPMLRLANGGLHSWRSPTFIEENVTHVAGASWEFPEQHVLSRQFQV